MGDVNKKNVNRFNLAEWSGAFGDIGLLLPLLFAFVIYNGYSHRTLFLVYGAAYVATGLYFRAPVGVQPLKAIAVAAVTLGYTWEQLADTALFFGIIFLVMSMAGLLTWLQRIFTSAVVLGLQVGLGIMLVERAMLLSVESGFFLGWKGERPGLNLLITGAVAALIVFLQVWKRFPASIVLIVGTMGVCAALGVSAGAEFLREGVLIPWRAPQWNFFPDSLIYLILPQLPLTISNAVYSSADVCGRLLPERAERATPKRLGISIGISNILNGLMGGFPMCHGSGGMTAHYMFGGRTGGAVIIMGGFLILSAFWRPLANLIFYIPIPLLSALLLITGGGLILFYRRWKTGLELAVMGVTAAIAVFTKNLVFAVAAGYLLERLGRTVLKRGNGEGGKK